MNTDLYSTMHVGSGTPVRATGERALVLGGGGSAGNAWVLGVLAGLSDAGLDATQADLIIGTSAGSTAAAEGPADMRRRLGAGALELPEASDDSWRAQWRATVAARLPGERWPERTMLITAVDASTGQPVVFDRDSGVELADAVAASCSSGPPYRIGESRFIDGGYRRSSENADLAAGCGRVLVLSPFGGRSRAPSEWNMHLAAQVDDLRAGGGEVAVILPDSNAREAFGDDMMDLSRRAPAARAGYDQARTLAGQLTEFWRCTSPQETPCPP